MDESEIGSAPSTAAVGTKPASPLDEAPVKGRGSVRIALASNTDGMIDGHFGSCAWFEIFDVSREAIVPIAKRVTAALGTSPAMDGEKTGQRLALVRDCDILGVQSIGGPPAARVVNAGIMPLKFPRSRPGAEVLQELQHRLHHPPPWLLRAMGVARSNHPQEPTP
ncbi:MAG: hypothetical protein HQL73_04655 [Magnetococcales bacterium]|nr:hypothetical protein [Magnetococcales bacterium]